MSFKSLHQVLGNLEDQERWKGRRQFQQLLACWTEVVGVAVAAQTRPVAIQRQVLQVATSSGAWAQNLAFERCRILEKLNARLPLGITDIRFSTAQWRSDYGSHSVVSASDAMSCRDHPSYFAHAFSPQIPVRSHSPDPQTAFRDWARMVRSRSSHLPLCPACQCPAPEGELRRWATCALCAAKRFGGMSDGE